MGIELLKECSPDTRHALREDALVVQRLYMALLLEGDAAVHGVCVCGSETQDRRDPGLEASISQPLASQGNGAFFFNLEELRNSEILVGGSRY